MHTVKKLTPGETYAQIKINDKKSIVWNAGFGDWAVIDENGNVIFTKNSLSGKWQPEVYGQKGTAKKVADYYDRHPEAETTTFPKD